MTKRMTKRMTRRDFKGNIWRHLLVRAIEANGGYCARHDRYALEWNVACYAGIGDFDTLLAKAREGGNDFGITADTDLDAGLLAELKFEWDGQQNQSDMWGWVIDDMRQSVERDDTYRFLRPEIEQRYGVSSGESGFDVDWVFEGRGGKHLCLSRFQYRDLEKHYTDLAGEIAEDVTGEYSNSWCLKLLAFIHESDICFTREKVEQEFEYQVFWQFCSKLEEIADQTNRLRKEAAEAAFWAQRDVATEAA